MATPDPGRETLLLPLGAEPDPRDPKKTRPRLITLRYPTEGQFLVLSRLPKMVERGNIVEALTRFGDILELLIVQNEDRRWAYDGLTEGDIEPNAYLELLVGLLKHMSEDKEQAPTNGPAPRKRAAPRKR
jgi:hypothetical protein